MRPIFGMYKTYELLNLGPYSSWSRLQRFKFPKTANRPPPRPPVLARFWPSLAGFLRGWAVKKGVFRGFRGGGVFREKRTFFEKNVKFPKKTSKFTPKTPFQLELEAPFFRLFSTFFEISLNFQKFDKKLRHQGNTPTGRPSGGGAMRSIAGVNLRNV